MPCFCTVISHRVWPAFRAKKIERTIPMKPVTKKKNLDARATIRPGLYLFFFLKWVRIEALSSSAPSWFMWNHSPTASMYVSTSLYMQRVPRVAILFDTGRPRSLVLSFPFFFFFNGLEEIYSKQPTTRPEKPRTIPKLRTGSPPGYPTAHHFGRM